MVTGQDILAFSTLAIAIYGAVLGTYNLYLRIQEKIPKVEVSLSLGFVGTPGVWTSPNLLSLTANNIGPTVVNLASAGLILPDNRKMTYVQPDEYTGGTLPARKSPGESLTISREYDNIKRQLREQGFSGEVKLKGFFRDQVGNEYQGKEIRIPLDDK